MTKRTILLSCLLCLLFTNLWPSIQGKIEGSVTDSEGNALQGVTVTITSLKMSSRKFTLKTDKNGKYIQIGIWPDYYQVRFNKSGYIPVSKEIRVRIATTSRVDIVLEKAEEIIERTLSKADSLFLKGIKLYENKRYEEAAKSYEEAIQLHSGQWGYFFNLGLAYKKMDKKEEAMRAFQKAVELNPESFSSNKELGEILGKGGNFEEARKYYQRATEISPDDPNAFYNLGACLMNLGNSEEALKAFLKTIEIKEDFVDAYYPTGTLYIGQNKKEEAIKYLEKFLELAPDHEKADLARQLLDYLKK